MSVSARYAIANARRARIITPIENKYAFNKDTAKIVVTKRQLDEYVTQYLNRCTFPDLEKGIVPEMRLIKNISLRYENKEDKLTEIDKDLLINVLRINVDERDMRNDIYLHDLIFEEMITDFKLTDILATSKYFTYRSYL